jgi:hypothetical protein
VGLCSTCGALPEKAIGTCSVTHLPTYPPISLLHTHTHTHTSTHARVQAFVAGIYVRDPADFHLLMLGSLCIVTSAASLASPLRRAQLGGAPVVAQGGGKAGRSSWPHRIRSCSGPNISERGSRWAGGGGSSG